MPFKCEPMRWHRQIAAVAVSSGITVLTLMAMSATVAQTPEAGAVQGIRAFDPGKIGHLRYELISNVKLAPVSSVLFARQALTVAPLSSDPFVVAASQIATSRDQSDMARRERLLVEALHRDPRSGSAIMFLIQHYLLVGKLDKSVEHLEAMMRLNGAFVEQLMAGFGKAIVSNRNIDDMVTAMASHDDLFEPFIRGFAAAERSPELTLHLIDSLPRNAMTKPEVRRITIGQLVRIGEFARAQAMWRAGHAGAGNQPVHSPDFSDRKSLPPFNWQLEQNSAGVAELQSGGGLDVVYFGRTPGNLLSQLLVLQPGNYRAQLEYKAMEGTRGSMGLRVNCARTGALLAEARLFGQEPGGRAMALNFVVPAADCAGQIVSLGGLARQDSGRFEIVAHRLWIDRLDHP